MPNSNENIPLPASKDEENNKWPTKAVYEKPKLRTYDQIEQVRPYGPSEK